MGWHRYYGSVQSTGDEQVDGAQPSPFHNLGVSLYNYLETVNWAVFAEAAIPLTNNLDVEVGVRHEDYDLDAVTKPEFAARWDVLTTLLFEPLMSKCSVCLPNNPTFRLGFMRRWASTSQSKPSANVVGP